jgi:hypothetical protein
MRVLTRVAVAAAAAPTGVDHAKASKLRSRLRALVVLAVAAAAAPSGVDHAKASKLRALSRNVTTARRDSLAARLATASESGHLKRSFSSPPVASAQITSAQVLPRIAGVITQRNPRCSIAESGVDAMRALGR